MTMPTSSIRSCERRPVHVAPLAEHARSIRAVHRILRQHYRDCNHGNKHNPLHELLFIICSVQTQEANYVRTYRALRTRFPSLSSLARASVRQIEKPLVSGGLYRNKARMIRLICDAIIERFGRLSLEPLRQLDDLACENFLTLLPGVGKKVSRCVMMYSLGRHVFPVDTHCWRICRRLGWVRATRSGTWCTKGDMDRLQSKIPPDLRRSFHVNMISLGRAVCRQMAPRCGRCPIELHCKSRQRMSKSRQQAHIRHTRTLAARS